jgi:D-sedoheptulose 7-phosphate isomerase
MILRKFSLVKIVKPKMKEKIRTVLKESISIKERLCQDDLLISISNLVELVIACLKNGGKIILFGNGGSAADAQHIAAELVGRFTRERKALASVALNCNSSNLTAIGNDYGFEQIFARQIEGLGNSKDLAIGISTSGKSANVIAGISCAKRMGRKTAALTGEKASRFAAMVDVAICIPSQNTARIQEAHITIGHILCQLAEEAFLH